MLSHLGICEQWSTKTAPESRVVVMYKVFDLFQRKFEHRGSGMLFGVGDLTEVPMPWGEIEG